MKRAISAIWLCLALLGLLLLPGCLGDDEDDEEFESRPTLPSPATTAASGSGVAGGTDWYRPVPGTSWQWQLSGAINTGYDVTVYDIDLFDTDAALIAELQAAGRKVICYFSAGSYEEWRDDAARFPAEAVGETLDGWPDERWLDIRDAMVRQLMRQRLDLAQAKGCDGVEPDNITGYNNDTGFDLTAADQLNFNRFLAAEAHARGLAIGLKNDLEQIPALVGDFDFAVNEECFAYDECEAMLPFIEQGKAVFSAEYEDEFRRNPEPICTRARELGFSTLILPLDLDDSFRIACS